MIVLTDLSVLIKLMVMTNLKLKQSLIILKLMVMTNLLIVLEQYLIILKLTVLTDLSVLNIQPLWALVTVIGRVDMLA